MRIIKILLEPGTANSIHFTKILLLQCFGVSKKPRKKNNTKYISNNK